MHTSSKIVFLLMGGATLAASVFACIIPDRDIVVINTHPCGHEWTVSAVGAYGYDINGEDTFIQDDQDRWLAKTYCVNDGASDDLADETSVLYGEVWWDIIELCQERAAELHLADLDETCMENATVAYVGHCYPPAGGCDDGGESETGGASETGEAPEPGDTGPLEPFDTLDLAAEIVHVGDEIVISQHLIDVALADPVGVSRDGTTPVQVSDAKGMPRGFEITGARSDNLGGLLGLRDGDVVVSVAGQATTSYVELLELAAILLDAHRAAMVIERDGVHVTVQLRRGS